MMPLTRVFLQFNCSEKNETMFQKLFSYFRHKDTGVPQALQIEGVETPLTPEPDDAELAAQAILEMMAAPSNSPKGERKDTAARPIPSPLGEDGRGLYYRQLATRIREAYKDSALRATRFVAYCEQELRRKKLPLTGAGSLGLLEPELYKRIDIVEREGGELKSRWQRCLAEVTLRMMDDIRDNPENIL